MEGMYYVRFHNCLHKNVSFDIDVSFSIFSASPAQLIAQRIAFQVLVTEKNGENNYLSAGEMPLPFIYFAAAASFFIGGIIWMCLLCYKWAVFKIFKNLRPYRKIFPPFSIQGCRGLQTPLPNGGAGLHQMFGPHVQRRRLPHSSNGWCWPNEF